MNQLSLASANSYRLANDHRSLGVSFTEDGKATIITWAPRANQVAINLQKQLAPLPLNRDQYGYWSLVTDQISPGDLYTFILNGHNEHPDPTSLFQPQGVFGPSEAVETGLFCWTDQHWQNPHLDQYLIYELHTGTFTKEGTFAAIEEKLDHLVALGINAIELMPIAQFCDSRNWGYDGVFPFAAQATYGGPAGLQHLTNACHQRGIAVVLDVVYNHFGPEGNNLQEFGPYLTSKYSTPWGEAVNFDDAWCDGVRRFVVENVLMWLRDFHIDALRMDAVHAIKDCSPVHILQEIRQQVDQLMERTGRRHYLIIENDLNDPRFINSLAEGGYGMDAQWMDEFHHALRVTAGEPQRGYYADYDGVNHLVKSYQDAYIFDGQYSVVRQRFFGRKAAHNPGHQFVVFSQNHDQIGNRKLGERSSQLYSFGMQKLLAGAVLVSPYLPLLFMGEEWGETNPFLYFVSHADETVIEAVRQGRQEEFAAFHDEGDDPVPDPQDKITYVQSHLQWERLHQKPHQTMLRYYQTLIKLRLHHPALRTLNREQLAVTAQEAQRTLTLHRWHKDQHVLCLLNFSSFPQRVCLPVEGSQWQKLFDSADQQWQRHDELTPSLSPTTFTQEKSLWLSPESLCIYTADWRGK
ncbi:malto-oligosyltrehalose trehalohydrolase [Spirosoma oryzicola]|uniref:malto-oligosyltrehalose trehalohydrolase n=1 Tax=Spirosoma oryzicola TaxID=2898794 RepID=UPI001E51B849|nr:malto-oligosyltrehalose trehalohydrolase [Spirosoma oryzicola]UHG94650.1 malto-oligosyltrehalose trehalohydrolase [Spirosoma oryzicola]